MSNTPLARVPAEQMSPQARAAWTQLNQLTGEPSFVEVFASAPHLLSFVMEDFYTRIFFQGQVPQRYKQLMRLKLSMVHGCRTCNLQNVPAAREAGISDAQIAAIDDYASGPFSAADKAVLAYAELVSVPNQSERMDDRLYAALKAHFDDPQICELGVVGAVISGLAKLSFVLDLVEQEDYCCLLYPPRTSVVADPLPIRVESSAAELKLASKKTGTLDFFL